jgi:hypothetical protein
VLGSEISAEVSALVGITQGYRPALEFHATPGGPSDDSSGLRRSRDHRPDDGYVIVR